MGDKSLLVTYFLWLTLGWWGVHHFYLRRDRQAFVWFWTMGGCCGIGWLAEMFRLPSYVRLANGEGVETAKQAARLSRGRVPAFSWQRFAGEMIFALIIGIVTVSAVYDKAANNWHIVMAISPLAIATGVHTVANIGNQQCPFLVCLIAASIPLPMCFFLDSDTISTAITYSALTSAIGANWIGKRWKPVPSAETGSQHVCVRLLILTAASLLMVTLLMSAAYYNCYVTTRDGEQIPIKDALHNIMTSPAWAEFRETVYRLYRHLVEDGLESFLRELSIALDPEGEESAYRTLGLTSRATQKDITDRYRQLVKQFHPDKVHTSHEEQKKAETYFIEIQRAYEKLSVIRQRRASKTEL